MHVIELCLFVMQRGAATASSQVAHQREAGLAVALTILLGWGYVAWVILLINMCATFARRKYTQMYVALWYAMGCIMWTAFVYVIGNWPNQVLPQGWGVGFASVDVTS